MDKEVIFWFALLAIGLVLMAFTVIWYQTRIWDMKKRLASQTEIIQSLKEALEQDNDELRNRLAKTAVGITAVKKAHDSLLFANETLDKCMVEIRELRASNDDKEKAFILTALMFPPEVRDIIYIKLLGRIPDELRTQLKEATQKYADEHPTPLFITNPIERT